MSGRDEKFLPLADAVFQETGQHRHLSTCIRWTTKGSKGVKLKSWLVGGRRLTTLLAVRQFINTLSAIRTDGVESLLAQYRDAVQSGDVKLIRSAFQSLQDHHGVDLALVDVADAAPSNNAIGGAE